MSITDSVYRPYQASRDFVQSLFPFTKVKRHFRHIVDTTQRNPVHSVFGVQDRQNNISYLKGEVDEFIAEVNLEQQTGKPNTRKIQDELGDVLYSATVAGLSAGVDPNLAMVQSLQKIQRRLKHVEQNAPNPKTKEQFKIAWEKAKAALG